MSRSTARDSVTWMKSACLVHRIVHTQLHYSPSCGHGMQIGIAASLRITHGGVARLCGVSEHYVLGLPAYVTLTALVF